MVWSGYTPWQTRDGPAQMGAMSDDALSKLDSPNMKTLKDLFLTELADMHDAEHRILKALPEMARLVTSDALTRVILSYLKETEGHVTRLEQVFQCFDQKPLGRTCKGVAGLLDEAEEIASTFKGSPTINSAIIASARKIGHYQMAAYGCLHEWALQLGGKTAAGLLRMNLDEGLIACDLFAQLAHPASVPASKKAERSEGAFQTKTGGDGDLVDANTRRLTRVH